ncbi:MAG: hypothetical protein ALECFALPRED_006212 [Alectoria fallacina]|uniref:AB hydrolase-1 domain-containing protein n=1 Tax=Alectoria fallacina TaxID=1903189 RepID=A0A8H3G3A5_9LECA|nr:MAG: hypothetical protein ALECFALPRED_006212 [Alectoria fallacina]
MDATKPTILFIPGAWFHPSTYDSFISHLQKLSFPTVYASYPSLDPSHPATADAANDTETVLKGSLLPLIENEGKDVVVVMHSYGGLPGSSAARGLSKAQRSGEGKKGGVVGLIHISGFVLPGGASVADGQGGELPAWVKQNEPSSGLTMPDNPLAILSADIDPAIAMENASRLVPHALLAFKSPAPAPAWADSGFEDRLAYLVCTEDQAIPKFGQEAMMQATGLNWAVREMMGSHNSPFLKKTDEAVEAVDAFVGGFLKLGA